MVNILVQFFLSQFEILKAFEPKFIKTTLIEKFKTKFKFQSETFESNNLKDQFKDHFRSKFLVLSFKAFQILISTLMNYLIMERI